MTALPQAIVLVPGNGTNAKAILGWLPTITKAKATQLATALLQYHSTSSHDEASGAPPSALKHHPLP